MNYISSSFTQTFLQPVYNLFLPLYFLTNLTNFLQFCLKL